jgi:pimeloyl-ACP methyl ester carboxylesterase
VLTGAAGSEVVVHRYLRRALAHSEVLRLSRSARRHQTPHAGGVVAWYEWGSGPPVVLLHGGFGSWLHWIRTIDALASRFRVLAADLPGLGESDAVAAEAPSAAEVAAPLIDGLERLLAPGEPLRLGAFSLGAAIGAQVASAGRRELGRLVLLGPSGLGALWHNRSGQLDRRRPDMSEDARRAVIRRNLEQSMIANARAVDDLAIDLQLDLVQQRRGLRGLPISQSRGVLDALPALAARTTLVWGEADPYPCPDARGVAAVLGERLPELDVRIVEGAGHWVAYEAPETINPILSERFASTADGR